MEFTTTSKEAHANGVKVLGYGGAGAGKTAMCATAPRPVIISAESGLLSLSKPNLERMFGKGTAGITYDIPVIKIANAQDLQQASQWVAQSAEMRNFDTICLDSVSEIAEAVLIAHKKSAKDPRQSYGYIIDFVESTFRWFRDLPGKNVYFSAKMEPYKDELTGAIKYGPSMPGSKLGPKLPYFFDEVFRLGVGKTPQGDIYRFVQTQPDNQYEAKDRSGALAPYDHPHLGYLFNKIGA